MSAGAAFARILIVACAASGCERYAARRPASVIAAATDSGQTPRRRPTGPVAASDRLVLADQICEERLQELRMAHATGDAEGVARAEALYAEAARTYHDELARLGGAAQDARGRQYRPRAAPP